MNTATLRVTPVELAYVKRLVEQQIDKLKKDESKYANQYLKQVLVLHEKILDAIISF